MKKRYIAIFLVLGIVIGAGGGIGGTIVYNKLSDKDTSSKYYVEYKPIYDFEKGCRVTPDDVDYYKRYYSLPDEMLDANTSELLNAMLDTEILRHSAYPYLAADYSNACYYRERIYKHEGYISLINRRDLLDALEAYSKDILDSASSIAEDEPELFQEDKHEIFKVLIDTGAVRDRLTLQLAKREEYPSLFAVYDTITKSPYFPDMGILFPNQN